MKKIFTFFICFFLYYCSSDDDKNTVTSPPVSDIPEGFIGRYSLNGNAIDDSEFQNHGIMEGINYSISNRNDYQNSSIAFRPGSYIHIENTNALNPLNSISISVWVKAYEYDGTIINGEDPWRAIANKWQWFSGYYLGINPEGHLRWNINGRIIETEDQFITNIWTHIVATYDGEYSKLYINKELINTYPYTGEIELNNSQFTIGHQSGFSNIYGSFQGAIDEVVIYERALNEEEINQLFNDEY